MGEGWGEGEWGDGGGGGADDYICNHLAQDQWKHYSTGGGKPFTKL